MATQATQKISKGWKETTLGEVAEKIAMGPFGSNIKVETFVDSGVPVISGTHLHGTKLEDKGYNFVTEKHAEDLKSANVFSGDVIFTHAGNIGQVAFIPKNAKYKKYILSQRQFYLRPNKEKLLAEFITYFFKTSVGQYKLLANANQTGVPSIARPASYLKSINVALPSVPEQRAIVDVLTSLDDKIEFLREQNKTLETTAQVIFKEWFSVKSDKLPKGWRIEKLGELVNLTIGRTPPRKEPEWFSTNPTDIKWLSIKDLGNAGVFVSETSEYLTREGIQEHKIQVVPVNTVLISFKLTVGRVAITLDEMATNEAIAHLRLSKNTELNTEYLYLYFKAFNFSSIGSTSSIATAFNSESLRGLDVLVPEKNVLKKFAETTEPIFRKVANNVLQIRTLSKSRDALLPKLMGGEVRVRGFDV